MENTDACYASHLAAVNKHNKVTASEDIYNAQGVLLISRGTEIEANKAEIIARHKLVKPLEQSVDIASSLDDKGLLDLLNKFSATVPGLQPLIKPEPVQAALLHCCKQYNKYPLLRQKLTVFSRQMPVRYHHGIFSALVGVLIAKDMQLSEDDEVAAFLAGLVHDVGMLHIPPEISEKVGRYTPEERRTMEAHTVIGKRFLDMVPGLPASVSRAVLEHHETALGTGYPKRRQSDQLAIIGQIVAKCDLALAYYNRYKSVEGLSKELTLTALRLNRSIHFEKVNQSAVRILRQVNVTVGPIQSAPSIDGLVQSQQRLKSQFEKITQLVTKLSEHIDGRINRSIASMYDQVSVSMVSAGIFQDEFKTWLQDDGANEAIELLKLQVMLDEVEFQLKRLQHLIWEGIEDMPSAKAKIKSVAAGYYKKLLSADKPAQEYQLT